MSKKLLIVQTNADRLDSEEFSAALFQVTVRPALSRQP